MGQGYEGDGGNREEVIGKRDKNILGPILFQI